MSTGSIGVSTNGREYIKKVKPIPCNCEWCVHSRKGAGTRICKIRDEINPRKTTCKWYYAKPGAPRIKSKTTSKRTKKK